MSPRQITAMKKNWLMLLIAVTIVFFLPFPFFKLVRADDDNLDLYRDYRFYSTATVKKFCRYAQRIIARSKLKAVLFSIQGNVFAHKIRSKLFAG